MKRPDWHWHGTGTAAVTMHDIHFQSLVGLLSKTCWSQGKLRAHKLSGKTSVTNGFCLGTSENVEEL